MHFADSVAYARDVIAAAGREGYDAVLEDEDVDHGGWRRAGTLVGGVRLHDEGLKGDQVVVLEHVDFLAGLLNGNVLGCQGVDVEGL